MGIMRTKSVEQSIRDTEEPEFQLRKALGPLDLTLFGIGVIIGTGLFVLTGEAAAGYAGPAVALSYVVGGIVCALAALCYAEFASTVPVAGSAYTFSYATLGEFVAWLIGWDLILEFTLGAATVAKGWSGYLVSVFDIVGIKLLTSLYASPESGVSHDWIALIVVALVTTILVIGIRLSSQFNAVITTIKILVTLCIIGFGIFFIKTSNLTPFIPPPKSGGGAPSVSPAEPFGDRHHIRRARHLHGGGGAGFLRLYRFRHRGHHLRGGAQSPESPAHRHSGRPGDLHGSLHPGLHRLYGARALPGAGYRGPGGYGPRSDTFPGSAADRLFGDPHRAYGGGDDPGARPEPGGLRDELGQSAAALVLTGPSHLPHAVPDHDNNRYSLGVTRGLPPAGNARRAREHRDARRLRVGLHRGHGSPADAARPPTGVQGTRLSRSAYPLRHRVRLPHGLSDHRHLVEVLRLDGDRARDLLR